MPPADAAFLVLAALTLLGALIAVGHSSIFRSALGLMLTLMGVAGLYLVQRAEFLAVVQVLVYVGGISVLIVFAIMLTEREGTMRVSSNRLAPLAAVVGALLAGGVTLAVLKANLVASPPASVAARDIGSSLVNLFLVPFEAVSVLLLVALLGALLIARE